MKRARMWIAIASVVPTLAACELLAGIQERELVTGDASVGASSDASENDLGPTLDGAPELDVVVADLRVGHFVVDGARLFATTLSGAGERPRVVSIERSTGAVFTLAEGAGEGALAPGDVVTTDRNVYWIDGIDGPLYWRRKDASIPVRSERDPNGTTRARALPGATATRVAIEVRGVQFFDEARGFTPPALTLVETAASDSLGTLGVDFFGEVHAFVDGGAIPIATYEHATDDTLTSATLDAERFFWLDTPSLRGARGRLFVIPRAGGAPTALLDDVPSASVIKSDGETLYILVQGSGREDGANGELRTCAVARCRETVRVARGDLPGAAWLALDGERVYWSEIHDQGGRVVAVPKRSLVAEP